MRGRRLAAAVVGLVLAVGVVWRVWVYETTPVAPQVTARDLVLAEHHLHLRLTVVPAASRLAAHRLWTRYHDLPAYQGVKPRLLGVSLVHLDSGGGSDEPPGDYWLVFSDRVWQPNLGGFGGPRGYYSRQVILARAGQRSLSGDELLF
jgi:hypothetical protein